MASSNSQKDLILKLQKKVETQKGSAKQMELAREIQRCQQVDLAVLGAEVLDRGDHAGKTVHQVYTENLEYVVWILQHQAKNVNFVKLMEYTKRKEAAPQAAPTAKAAARPQPTIPEVNSGNTPAIEESDNDWEEMTSQPGSASNETQEIFKAMMGAFNELKLRMDGLQQSAENHQVHLHQGLSAISQLQNHQENIDHRLSSMEQKAQNQ